MSRTSHRSRISLLASTSFVAANILAGAGALTATAFAPSVALAACASNAATNVIEICSPPDPVNKSLTYTAAGNTALQLIDVNITENAAPGITVNAGANNFGITFDTVGGAGAQIASTGGSAITMVGTGASLSVTTLDFNLLTNTTSDKANTISGNGGIFVNNFGAGTSSVIIGGLDTVTSNTANYAIRVDAVAGDATVTTKTGSVVSNAGSIITVASQTTGAGSAIVNIGGAVTGGGALNFGAVAANAVGGGNGSVTLSSGAVVTGSSASPAVSSFGAASAIDIQAGATATNSSTGLGARVQGATTATLTVAGAITSGGALVTGPQATANVSGNITGGANDGLTITATTGAATLNQTAGTITAATVGKNGVTITGGAGGVVLNGTLGATINGEANGVSATVSGGGTVTGALNSNITATTGDGLHIVATGAGGVNLTTAGTITGGTAGDGIDIDSGAGITLVTNGAVSGDPGVILADASAVGINYTANAKVDGLLDGIKATETGTGDVSVTVAAAVTGDTDLNGSGNGVDATANGGTVSVRLNPGGSVTGAIGVNASTSGTGQIKIDTFGPNMPFTGTVAEGIRAVTTGTGAITIGPVGTVTGQTDGIFAKGGGTIFVQMGQGVTGATANGVHVDGQGGDIKVQRFFGPGVIQGATDGVLATNIGAGKIDVDTSIGGVVGTAGNAIETTAVTGATTITVGAATGGLNGVLATSGSGAVTVNTLGNVTGNNGSGVSVTTVSGVINVNTSGGTISATNGNGIDAVTTGAADVHVNGSAAINVAGVNNLLVNGSFETGTFAGWTQSGNLGFTTVSNIAVPGPQSGVFYVRAGPVGSDGFISQTFADIAGQPLTITGFAAGSGAAASNVSAAFNGNVFFSVVAPPPGYQPIVGNVVATGSDTLRIGYRNDPSFNGVDNFAVTTPASGIFAHTTGAGNVFVGDTGAGYAGAIDPTSGGVGIIAAIGNAASAGNVSVRTAAGGTITGNAAIGILATTPGTGSVTVDQAGAIGTAGNQVTTDGILATITNAANTNTVSVTTKGNIFATDDGVDASTVGVGAVNVTQTAGAIFANDIGVSAVINNALNVGGNVVVNTSGATSSITSGSDGILATTNGEGDVFVTHGAFILAGLAAGDAINASVTGAGDGSVTVTVTGTGTAVSVNGAGVKATTNSNDEVVVNNTGAIQGTTFGITATNSGIGGGVTVNQTGGFTNQTGADTGAGVNAQITNAGNSDQVWVNLTGGTVTASGDGVFAQTAGTGLVKVNVGAGVTVTGGNGGGVSNGDGVVAIGLGGGNVLVVNAGTINGDPGIIASAVGFGTATTISSGVVSAIGDGINSTTVDGANTVSITGAGTVTSTTADGIDAKSTGVALINITTSAASVITTTGGANGILANQTGTGAIDITALGQIDAGTDGIDATTAANKIDILTGAGKISGGAGRGIRALAAGVNNVTVTTGAGAVGSGPASGFFGIGIFSGGGDATVNIGAGGVFDGGVDVVTVGTGAATVKANGDVNATTFFNGITVSAADGPATVTLAAGKTITSAAASGIVASTTTGPIQVTTGVGSKITANGDGISTNTTLAAGTTLINANGAIDTTGGGAGSDGIQALSTGGLIQIFTGAGAINTAGDGILASGGGNAPITIVTGSGAITAAGLHGIRAGSTGGAINVTTNGAVTGQTGIQTSTSLAANTIVTTNGTTNSTAGNAIQAFTDGTGTVTVTTNGVTTAVGGSGIVADSATGKVTVLANAAVTGTVDGIQADADGAGVVFVNALGNVAGGTGNGIKAETDTGNVTVGAAGTVSGATGVFTTTGGAGVTGINVAGQITATAGNGVDALTSGSGKIDITTAGVTATNTGVLATSNGGGNVTATTNGAVIGDSDASGAGNGVDLFSSGGNGNVTANLGGTVSGANGVVLLASGTGAATVNGGAAANTITGTKGDGVNATAATGPITIGSGPGTRLQQAVAGTDDAISTTSAGNVTIFTAANLSGDTDADGVGAGVKVGNTGAGSTVTVDTTGGAIKAGADGISVNTAGGAGVVTSITNTDTIDVSGKAGIRAIGGDGSTTIVNSGAIAGTAFAAGSNSGILSFTTTGQNTVTNSGAIGAAGPGNGVDFVGIAAFNTGGGANTVTVNNSGNIFVDTGGFAGIAAGTVGTGDVTVNNTGVIDPPLFGIFMFGGGNVTANTAANVTGDTGISVISFGGTANAATVNVTGGAAITGTAGNGIQVFGPLGATAQVNATTSGAITGTGAGSNGIFALSKGDVNVLTGPATVTGGASGGAWGIKAISNPGGAGVNGAVVVTTKGLVTGQQGILAFANGTDATDSVTVTVGGNVTSTAGFGILTKAINGLNKVDLNTGQVFATGKDGISAASTGTGGITINTALGTDVDSRTAGANDIKAVTTGASGDINITVLGTLNLAAFAGHDAIFAQVNNAASTSNINISSQDRIWGSNVAANLGNGIEATSNGVGSITINANTTAAPVGSGLVYGGQNGINASLTNAAGTGNIAITAGDAAGTITGSVQSSFGGTGIVAKNAGTGNTTVTVNPGIFILAAGAGSIGIDAEATSGTVTVNSSGPTIGATNTDIFATGNGPVNVTNSATLNNATAFGINAVGGAGTVTVVNTGSLASLSGVQVGISATSVGGKIDVTNSGQIGSAGAGNGADGVGIYAVNFGGGANPVTVTNSGAIFVDNTGTFGIVASSNSTGNVLVSNSGVVTSLGLFGIVSQSLGGNATATTSANVVGQTGILSQTFGPAGKGAAVTVTGGATVTGSNGDAIDANSFAGGNVSVDTTLGGNVTGSKSGVVTSVTGAGTTGTTTINTLTSSNSALIRTVTGSAGDGVRATTSGSGAMTITTGNVTGSGAAGNTSSGIIATSTGGSAITVNTTGAVSGDATGNAAGTGAAGISAKTSGGNGNVVVNTSLTTNVVSGSVTGGNFGIVASSAGTGSTTVTNNVAVTASGGAAVNAATGPVGISATGGTGGGAVGTKTGVTVVTSANVSATNGRAIVTNSGNNAVVTIGAATVTGAGDAAHAVVDLTSVAGATTTLTNNGTITSKNAAPASYGDLAVKNTGGALSFANNGVLLGRLDGSLGQSVTMTNTSFTSWHTTGTSVFSPLADSLTNTGLIATNAGGAATTLDFAGGADLFTNSAGGVLVAGEGVQAASELILLNLETLTNNGTIVFGSTAAVAPFASDNFVNDKIKAVGTVFGGTGKLAMDADLFSIAQASCATLTAADCMAVGSTTGLNSIVVNDTNAHAVGAFNPNGIALVTGSTNAGANFKLDPTSEWYNAGKFGGVLDKPGLFFYDLVWSAANGGTSLLVGVPDIEAFELSEAGATAQDVWYASTQTWFDRQADLRVTLQGRADGWAPAVWLKVVGQWTDRDNTATFSLFNKSYSFDVGYRQDTTGLIGGVDVLRASNGTEGYVFGVQLGYMDSDVRFHSPSRSKLSGPTFGAYGTYMNGGFFLDGIVNANFLSLDVNMPTLPGPPTPFSTSTDVRSYGGQLETGYQMPIGSTAFWEPLASVSYVHTDIHDLSMGVSGLVTFPNTTSFRGSLGLRLGMSGDFQYYKVRVALTGRYWNEFDGTNDIVIVSPGPSNLALSDGLNGGFGEVTLGGNLFANGGGLSAFANAAVRFQSNYQSTSVTAGFRYQW